ncbi:hypothetical protein VTN02DRAFT_6021 [Thermoascus thermophilus]
MKAAQMTSHERHETCGVGTLGLVSIHIHQSDVHPTTSSFLPLESFHTGYLLLIRLSSFSSSSLLLVQAVSHLAVPP